MQGPEKNSYKEFDSKKKFLQLENSPPPPPPPPHPITLLMVRAYGQRLVKAVLCCALVLVVLALSFIIIVSVWGFSQYNVYVNLIY